MDEQDMSDVIELCNRLSPMIHRLITRLIQDHGEAVAMSVVCNISVSMAAQAMLIANYMGGDEQLMLSVMSGEARNRFSVLHSAHQADSLMARAMSGSTCSPTKH